MKERGLTMLIVVVIIGLGVTYASMHINFVVSREGLEEKHLLSQIQLADGQYPDHADFQSRIVFPQLTKLVACVVKKSSWALFLPEAICAVFSLYAFFLLALTLLGDKRYALLSTLALSAFTPFALQLTHRYGEPLLVGFYSILIYCVLREKIIYYMLFLILASLQRPDIALSSIFFLVAYDGLVKKKRGRALIDLALLAVPVAVATLIKLKYHIRAEDYVSTFFTLGFHRPLQNLKALPSLIMMYSPIFVLAGLMFRSFDRMIKLILISMIPYLLMVTLFGSYSESRLLLPFFSILIIGIVRVLVDKHVWNNVI